VTSQAVVAMRYEVLDHHAVAFSQKPYSSVAAGLSVNEAVAVGYRAMLPKSSDRNLDSGEPVLYMGSVGVTLFPV